MTQNFSGLESALLELGISGASLEIVSGEGKNNQSFIARLRGQRFFLKRYFAHAGDTRDRLGHEVAFLEAIRDSCTTEVPRLLSVSQRYGVALFEYLEGAPLLGEPISEQDARSALEFLLRCNTPGVERSIPLPTASEAAFSLAAHYQSASRRVARLTDGLVPSDSISRECLAFVGDTIGPALQDIAPRYRDVRELAETERIISPSDFGFHNSMRRPDGSLVFFDFEYAGWDDPAKTVCDFFLQPRIPVPTRYREEWIARIEELLPETTPLASRVAIIEPLYVIRWCCMLLNEFLPVAAARRSFAGHTEDRRESQLRRSQALFAERFHA